MSIERREDDEVVTVTLPRKDYDYLRRMIDRDKSVSVVWAYVRNVLIVAAAGLVTLAAAWEHVIRWMRGS